MNRRCLDPMLDAAQIVCPYIKSAPFNPMREAHIALPTAPRHICHPINDLPQASDRSMHIADIFCTQLQT